MNYQKTTEEIADVYIKRIIEQNKQQYSESYELGKRISTMFLHIKMLVFTDFKKLLEIINLSYQIKH